MLKAGSIFSRGALSSWPMVPWAVNRIGSEMGAGEIQGER